MQQINAVLSLDVWEADCSPLMATAFCGVFWLGCKIRCAGHSACMAGDAVFGVSSLASFLFWLP